MALDQSNEGRISMRAILSALLIAAMLFGITACEKTSKSNPSNAAKMQSSDDEAAGDRQMKRSFDGS